MHRGPFRRGSSSFLGAPAGPPPGSSNRPPSTRPARPPASPGSRPPARVGPSSRPGRSGGPRRPRRARPAGLVRLLAAQAGSNPGPTNRCPGPARRWRRSHPAPRRCARRSNRGRPRPGPPATGCGHGPTPGPTPSPCRAGVVVQFGVFVPETAGPQRPNCTTTRRQPSRQDRPRDEERDAGEVRLSQHLLRHLRDLRTGDRPEVPGASRSDGNGLHINQPGCTLTEWFRAVNGQSRRAGPDGRPGCSGWSPLRRPDGAFGGAGLACGGSEEGGREELDESWFSRASMSASRDSGQRVYARTATARRRPQVVRTGMTCRR